MFTAICAGASQIALGAEFAPPLTLQNGEMYEKMPWRRKRPRTEMVLTFATPSDSISHIAGTASAGSHGHDGRSAGL